MTPPSDLNLPKTPEQQSSTPPEASSQSSDQPEQCELPENLTPNDETTDKERVVLKRTTETARKSRRRSSSNGSTDFDSLKSWNDLHKSLNSSRSKKSTASDAGEVSDSNSPEKMISQEIELAFAQAMRSQRGSDSRLGKAKAKLKKNAVNFNEMYEDIEEDATADGVPRYQLLHENTKAKHDRWYDKFGGEPPTYSAHYRSKLQPQSRHAIPYDNRGTEDAQIMLQVSNDAAEKYDDQDRHNQPIIRRQPPTPPKNILNTFTLPKRSIFNPDACKHTQRFLSSSSMQDLMNNHCKDDENSENKGSLSPTCSKSDVRRVQLKVAGDLASTPEITFKNDAEVKKRGKKRKKSVKITDKAAKRAKSPRKVRISNEYQIKPAPTEPAETTHKEKRKRKTSTSSTSKKPKKEKKSKKAKKSKKNKTDVNTIQSLVKALEMTQAQMAKQREVIEELAQMQESRVKNNDESKSLKAIAESLVGVTSVAAEVKSCDGEVEKVVGSKRTKKEADVPVKVKPSTPLKMPTVMRLPPTPPEVPFGNSLKSDVNNNLTKLLLPPAPQNLPSPFCAEPSTLLPIASSHFTIPPQLTQPAMATAEAMQSTGMTLQNCTAGILQTQQPLIYDPAQFYRASEPRAELPVTSPVQTKPTERINMEFANMVNSNLKERKPTPAPTVSIVDILSFKQNNVGGLQFYSDWGALCEKLKDFGIGDWNFFYFSVDDLPADTFSMKEKFFIKQQQELRRENRDVSTSSIEDQSGSCSKSSYCASSSSLSSN